MHLTGYKRAEYAQLIIRATGLRVVRFCDERKKEEEGKKGRQGFVEAILKQKTDLVDSIRAWKNGSHEYIFAYIPKKKKKE